MKSNTEQVCEQLCRVFHWVSVTLVFAFLGSVVFRMGEALLLVVWYVTSETYSRKPHSHVWVLVHSVVTQAVELLISLPTLHALGLQTILWASLRFYIPLALLALKRVTSDLQTSFLESRKDLALYLAFAIISTLVLKISTMVTEIFIACLANVAQLIPRTHYTLQKGMLASHQLLMYVIISIIGIVVCGFASEAIETVGLIYRRCLDKVRDRRPAELFMHYRETLLLICLRFARERLVCQRAAQSKVALSPMPSFFMVECFQAQAVSQVAEWFGQDPIPAPDIKFDVKLEAARYLLKLSLGNESCSNLIENFALRINLLATLKTKSDTHRYSYIDDRFQAKLEGLQHLGMGLAFNILDCSVSKPIHDAFKIQLKATILEALASGKGIPQVLFNEILLPRLTGSKACSPAVLEFCMDYLLVLMRNSHKNAYLFNQPYFSLITSTFSARSHVADEARDISFYLWIEKALASYCYRHRYNSSNFEGNTDFFAYIMSASRHSQHVSQRVCQGGLKQAVMEAIGSCEFGAELEAFLADGINLGSERQLLSLESLKKRILHDPPFGTSFADSNLMGLIMNVAASREATAHARILAFQILVSLSNEKRALLFDLASNSIGAMDRQFLLDSNVALEALNLLFETGVDEGWGAWFAKGTPSFSAICLLASPECLNNQKRELAIKFFAGHAQASVSLLIKNYRTTRVGVRTLAGHRHAIIIFLISNHPLCVSIAEATHSAYPESLRRTARETLWTVCRRRELLTNRRMLGELASSFQTLRARVSEGREVLEILKTLGVSEQSISDWTTGQIIMSAAVVERIGSKSPFQLLKPEIVQRVILAARSSTSSQI